MRKKLFNFLPRGGFVKGLLLLAIALLGGVSSGWADADLTTQYLTNANFGTGNANGWTPVTSESYKDIGVGAIGTYKVRGEFPAATVDDTHLSTEYCAGLECRWSGNYASYTQTSSAALPAGSYVISFDVENTNNGTANVSWENRFYVKVGETTYNDGMTEWMKGQSSWTTHTIVFTITEPSTFTLSLGYGTGSNGIGHMNTPALFVSHVQLKKLEDASLPIDMTGYIQNWDFLNCGDRNFPGWTIDARETWSVNAKNYTTVECWKWNAENMYFDYYQTVTDLPVGKYKISARMWSDQGETLAPVGVYGASGTEVFKGVSNKCNFDSNNLVVEETDPIFVTNGSLRLGVKTARALTLGETAWHGADWVKLTYVGTELTADDIAAINAENPTGTMSEAIQEELNTAKNAFNASQTLENYVALNNAIIKAKASIATYNQLANGFPDNSTDGWTCTNNNTFHINTWSGTEGESGISVPYLENWIGNWDGVLGTGDIYYELPYLTPGMYTFKATVRARSEAGNNPVVGGSVFAGGKEVDMTTGHYAAGNTILYDDYSVSDAVGGENPTFRFGVRIKDDRNFNWVVFKNVSIEYEPFSAETMQALYDAAGIEDETYNNDVKTALNTALATAKATPNYENYRALEAAIEAAKASITTYETAAQWLSVNKAELESTNFVDPAVYQAKITDAETALADGTMTHEWANSINDIGGTEWHRANYIDDILLTPWKIGNEQAKEYDKSLYINVWSGEGNNDGSNFKTPFFEYWADDSQSLGENALTGTIEGIEPGDYAVTAWIRVRAKNGANAAPYGITMKANDGDAVEISGTQIGTSQLYLKKYAAFGTVGADGKLTLTFNIAADNNISWLAFKNVNYVKSVSNIAEFKDAQVVAEDNKALLNLNGAEMILQKDGLTYVQDMTGGIVVKGYSFTGANPANAKLAGQLYGTHRGDTIIVDTKFNGNEVTASTGEATINNEVVSDATKAENEYRLVQIDMASITKSDGVYYANQEDGASTSKIAIDNRLYPDLVLNEGDILNTLIGITFPGDNGNVIAPQSQDDVLPLLWKAEDFVAGEFINEKAIDLTTEDVAKRIANLKAGDVLNVKLMPVIGTEVKSAILTVANENGTIYDIPVQSNTDVVEIPVTAFMEKLIQKHGLTIKASNDNVKAQYIIVLNNKYADVENSIWLGPIPKKVGYDELTLGSQHFREVYEGDQITRDAMADISYGIKSNFVTWGTGVEQTSRVLAADDVNYLLNNEMWLSECETMLKVAYIINEAARTDKAEVEQNADGTYPSFKQGDKLQVNGMVMYFGGDAPDGKKYEYAEAYPEVNSFGSATEGIDQLPTDAEGNAFDKEQNNVPTKGTYYKFVPTMDGKLEITAAIEAGKTVVFAEEGGEAKMDKAANAFEGKNAMEVEAAKTYYLFSTDSNLKFFGYKFTPADDNAKNLAKDIATFKELPTPVVNEGDTLMLKDAVVTYIKSDHVFVEDASGAIDFYQTGIQFYVGQKLNGYIVGKNGELQYLPALFRTDDTKYGNFKVTETITPEPTVIDVTEAAMKKNLARFVKLENLMLKKDSRGFKILVDTLTGNNIHVQDHFGVFYELNDTVKSIEGIAGIDADSVYTLWPTSKDGVISSKTIIPEPTLPMPTDGKYYLQNMASGLFWGAGNSWSTQASLLSHPAFVTLAKQPDGTYTMDSQVNNGGLSHYFNGSFMDNDSPVNLTFTPEMITVENEVALTKDMFKTWTSNVAGAEPTAAQPPFESHLGENSGAGSTLYGNGSVQYLTYADLTGYKKLVADATPGMRLRVLLNRLEVGNGGGDGNGGALTEVFVDINSEGKGELDLTQYDYAHLNAIKIPWGAQAGTVNSLTAVEEVPQAIYTISNGSVMYGNNGTNTVIDATGVSDDDNAKWQIFTEEEMNASLSKATQANPVDATFLILDPDFGRNNRYAGGLSNNKDHIKGADLDAAWDFQASNKDNFGANENFCVESYHSLFALSQTLANAPKGVYSLTAQGFYRQDGSDNEHLPVFYANDETKVFPLKTGSENSMNDASNSFIAGKYTIDPIFVEVTEEGKLTIGTKLEGNTNLWCIWDNFELTYYGTNANIDELKGGAEMKELQELREKATELSRDEAIEVAAVKTALSNALNQSANVSGSDAIKAAIASLKAAIESAQASKTAKDVLPKMKELVDANNVYTQEAYDQYYGTWIAKYNAGTLTQAEASALQDPTTVTGWHAQITVDNFLLSAWDTNPDFNNAAYYINSWSDEGDKDGTNFHVPFFEYFRRATDGSLEEKTLTATMNGLEAGDYTVNAWVRVALTDKTGDEAYGINMQVNDGTAVDVCDGDMVDCGDSERFFLKEVSANGTVGADGVLTIKFNVASDNNIHWISFKNVKYTKAGAGDETDPNLIEIAQDQGKTLDTFERAELVEGSDYNTYTANNNLVIAFKMVNIDVNNCDYVVIKFAEPVAAGWHLAFWSNQDLVDVEAGATEYKYIFANDPKCGIQDGILPQICMMTFFGGFQAPLVAKVTGVYKHLKGVADKIDGITGNLFDDGAIYNLRGQKVEGKLKPGLYIKNGRKVVIK